MALATRYCQKFPLLGAALQRCRERLLDLGTVGGTDAACRALQEAYWFYLDEIVDEAKGDYPKLQTSVFIQLLLETDGHADASAGSVATPVLSRSLPSGASDWVQTFAEWSELRLAQSRCGAILFDERLESLLMVMTHRGLWCFPSGKVEGDETEVQCAVREVQEELGLDISEIIDPRQQLKIILKDKERNIPVTLFIITSLVKEKLTLKPRTKQEIAKIAWIRTAKLPGWSPGEATKLRFFKVDQIVPLLKRWLQRYQSAEEDPKRQQGATVDAALPWLDVRRALRCFDDAWDACAVKIQK